MSDKLQITLLEELRTVELLEAEIKQDKAIVEHELEYMLPKNVGSVNYENERVQGGISKGDNQAIMEIAKEQDKINKLEELVGIIKEKINAKLDVFYNALTEQEAKLFKMRYIQGRSIYEIADLSDITDRQVYRRLKEVKRKIALYEINKTKIIDTVLQNL